MSITQYQLSWDSFISNICEGFTNLQQKEEFVDMTLVADGHQVKVHKNIFALASPYIKFILQTTPNEHPIIFLSNVSHEVLNYILTYVYTGEVYVEVDKIQAFMRVAKDLRLSGLFGMPTPKVSSKNFMKNDLNEQKHEGNDVPDYETIVQENITNNMILNDTLNMNEPESLNIDILNTADSSEQINVTNAKKVTTKYISSNDINIYKTPETMPKEELMNNRDRGLFMTADGYQYKLEIQQGYNNHSDSTPVTNDVTSDDTTRLIQPSTSINTVNNDNFGSFEDEFKKKINTAALQLDSLNPTDITPQYTMSNRGFLQLILNRYMYHCHHQSHGGRKRRWRCIEYRSKFCPAFIDTDGEIMTSRKFGHCHSFHDEKIRKKMKKDLVFTNLNVLLKKLNQENKSKKGTN